jgi:hypothetical protein
MSTRGSVTRLIIDLRSDEAAVRELAARLVLCHSLIVG